MNNGRLLVTLFALFCVGGASANAQVISSEWTKHFGGTSKDQASVVIQCSDGKYLLGGESLSSVSGNKTSPSLGGLDWWVLRLDSFGEVIWQRSFGGASTPNFPTIKTYDYLGTVIEKPGGGFLLFGHSMESMGGTKTMRGNGDWDFYIVAVDQNGNQIWDKSIGSTLSDWPASVRKTADGGYIMVGSTRRSGNEDVWVVRLNAGCDLLWERTFGGTNVDRGVSVFERANGGFCIGANSASPPSGNKTSPFYGGGYLTDADGDFWILYLDADGGKLHEHTFGGVYDEGITGLEPTVNGGVLVTGFTTSPVSGNKTSSHTGSYAGWMVCLDGDGEKMWERVVGGSYSDWIHGLTSTADGGFLMIAMVDYVSSIFRLNAAGSAVWQQPSSLPETTFFSSIAVTTNGGFLLTGSHQPETNGFGGLDMLIAKYSSEPPHIDFASSPPVISNNFGFGIVNTAKRKIVIEASTGLTEWVPVHTNEQRSVQFHFIDTSLTSARERFYRVRSEE